MAYTLPPLPYPLNALEPHIDAKTMEIHHGKHHQAYINNANAVLKDYPELEKLTAEQLLSNFAQVPDAIKTPLRNNAGGHANHSLFWTVIGPNAGGTPTGPLADAINAQLGGFDKFKEDFAKAATTRFGSGWAWLVVGKDGKLAVISTANQDSPLMDGQTPILGLDVWEHAYYLHYQNRRPDYIAAFFNIINWNAVAERYAAATK
jgi:Fe-Mn family superoxide dismutase